MKNLLADYGLASHFEEAKEWYDGYHFGNVDVYCPWDVINYVDNLVANPTARPQTYWINSSGNSLVRRLINIADSTTKDEVERLIAGESIEKVVHLELTYNEIDKNIDNIWSVLFTTGYLTKVGEAKAVCRLEWPRLGHCLQNYTGSKSGVHTSHISRPVIRK